MVLKFIKLLLVNLKEERMAIKIFRIALTL